MATNKARIEITAVDRTKGAVRSVNKGLRSVTSSLLSMQGAIAAVVGVAGMGALISQSFKTGDALAKTADKLGTTTQALAGLRHAAELTGVSQKALDTSMQRLTRRLSEANAGYGAGIKGLDALGLKAADLLALPLDQQMQRIAGAMANVETQADRVRIAAALFDQEGVNLVNTLALGEQGLKAAAIEADALGVAISRVDAAKLEAANDSFFKVGQAIRGIGNRIAIELAPYLKVIADRFVNLAKNGRGFGEVVVSAVEKVALAFAYGGNVIQGWRFIIGGVKLAFAKAAEVILKSFEMIPFFGDRFTLAVDAAIANTERLKLELQSIAHEGLASDRIREQFALLRDQAVIEAETMAAARVERQQIEIASVAQHNQTLVSMDTEKTAALVKNRKRELSALEKFNALSWDNQVKQVSGSLLNMTRGVSQSSKTMFRINKAAGITNAIINTSQGVTQALAAYPPPLSFAMAAAQLAAGIAQVQAIRSTSFGSGTAPSAAGTGAGAAPVATTPAAAPSEASAQGASETRNITINFEGSGLYSKDDIRDLIDAINTELGDGATLSPA